MDWIRIEEWFRSAMDGGKGVVGGLMISVILEI
jgi:hypothetical protein